MSCSRTSARKDKGSGSKFNRGQVQIMLDLVDEFVQWACITDSQVAENFAVVSPYPAQVDLIDRKKTLYPRPAALRPSKTIQGFQGSEAIIVWGAFGTSKNSGPDFTTNRQRLNFFLSRPVSGMVLFGDINVTGKGDAKAKARGKGKSIMVRKPQFRKSGINWFAPNLLDDVHDEIRDRGRVAYVTSEEPDKNADS